MEPVGWAGGDRGAGGESGLRWIGRQTGRAAALLVWAGICGYAWFRGALATSYTVAAVGGVVGVMLLAALVDDREWLPTARPGADRWLIVGCLLGVAAGTVGVGRTVVGGAGRPDGVPGVILVAVLVVLAWRLCGSRLAGPAALAVVVAAAADPTPRLVTTVLDGPVGVYGGLTRAITWLGPVCLLVGLWEAAGLDRQWRAVGPADGGPSGAPAGSRRLLGVAALVGVLIAWQTAGTGRPAAGGVVWGIAALLPVALSPAVFRPGGVARGQPTDQTGGVAGRAVDRDVGRLVVAVGPIALMGWLLVGPRPPVGVVVVAGCLLAIGLCLLAALVRTVAGGGESPTGQPEQPPIGGRTVVDGGVGGVGLLGRVVVVLTVVGAAVAAAETLGLSTRLLSGALWLGGGHPAGALVVLGGLCLLVGAVVPTLAGYAMAALVVVPLVRTIAAVGPLVAHLGVWYVVAAGALLAVVWRRSNHGGRLAGVAGAVIRARA